MTKSDTILKSEKAYVNHLIEYIHKTSEICGWGEIKRIETEYTIRSGKTTARIDIMIWHKDGTGTCIEVKTGNNNRNDDLMAIGQLLFYGNEIEKQLGKKPRMVLVHPELKKEIFSILKNFNIPISYLNFTDNKCIYLSNGTR